MGLGKLFPAPDKRPAESRMAGEHFFSILDGASWEGNTLRSYRGGMSIPGAWKAVLLISNLIAHLPWNAYRQRGGNPTQLISPTPSLLDQPAPPELRIDTFTSWAMDLIWHGNAVGVIATRDQNGYPTAVLPVPAEQVFVRRANFSDLSPIPFGPILYEIGGDTFTEYEVIHIRGPHRPGATRGFGVLEAHLSEPHSGLRLARELGRQAGNIGQSGVPTGVLKVSNPDATEDDLRDAKAGWLRNQRDRTVAVLNATTEFQPLAWNPEQMELVEARKFSLLELSNIFNVPPRFLGASSGDSMTYSNSETEAIDLIKFSLSGHLGRFEQALTQCFPKGTCVKADLDGLLRADTMVRYQAYSLAIGDGWLRRSEVREREDLPPVEGIDDEPLPKKAEQDLLKTDPVAPTLASVPPPGAQPAREQQPQNTQHEEGSDAGTQ